MNQPRWLTFLLVTVALLTLFFVCHCGGSDSTDLFTPSFPNSPVTDGGLSEDSLAGSDGARSPGLDATDAGEFRGEVVAEDSSTTEPDANNPTPLDSHVSDPWPEDVVVERVAPPPNCFVDFQGQLACCFPHNQPPVDCALQKMPQFCVSCPR
jgi:hypothetical protein